MHRDLEFLMKNHIESIEIIHYYLLISYFYHNQF